MRGVIWYFCSHHDGYTQGLRNVCVPRQTQTKINVTSYKMGVGTVAEIKVGQIFCCFRRRKSFTSADDAAESKTIKGALTT